MAVFAAFTAGTHFISGRKPPYCLPRHSFHEAMHWGCPLRLGPRIGIAAPERCLARDRGEDLAGCGTRSLINAIARVWNDLPRLLPSGRISVEGRFLVVWLTATSGVDE